MKAIWVMLRNQTAALKTLKRLPNVVTEFEKTVRGIADNLSKTRQTAKLERVHAGHYCFEFRREKTLVGYISVELVGFAPAEPELQVEVSVYKNNRDELQLQSLVHGSNAKILIKDCARLLPTLKNSE